MASLENIRVNLVERSYDICVEPGSTSELRRFDVLAGRRHVLTVTDENVAKLYLDSVNEQLIGMGLLVDSIVVPVGENSKSVKQLEKLWNQLLELNTDRRSLIVALGGGVVGDLAGFAAASFARGLPFIQIPTSLLAQVDSSVGGKVGINLPGAKNMVGAFWQPKFVLIDPQVLSTLDKKNYISGLAEVVKYAVIMDPQFFKFLQENIEPILARDPETLTTIIATCCRLKAQIVKEDETESVGRRAILNYGHTFGHAIENVSGYGMYLHGEAIAIGMQSAARLARTLGMIDDEFVVRQSELLEAFGLPLTVDRGKEKELLAAMHRDKKVKAGKIMLVLPTSIGQVELCESPTDELLISSFAWSDEES